MWRTSTASSAENIILNLLFFFYLQPLLGIPKDDWHGACKRFWQLPPAMTTLLRLLSTALILTTLLGLLAWEVAGRGPFGSLWVPYLLLLGYGVLECLWSHVSPRLGTMPVRRNLPSGGALQPIRPEPPLPVVAPDGWITVTPVRVRRARAIVALEQARGASSL